MRSAAPTEGPAWLAPGSSSSAPVSPASAPPASCPSSSRGSADIVIVNPTDYFLYLPLLPEVAAGILEPRRVTVSLAAALPGVRVILGEVDGFDLDGRTVTLHRPGGRHGHARLPPPGHRRRQRQQAAAGARRDRVRARLPRHPRGAVPARPHHPADRDGRHAADEAERAARCTFVVVGAGYTGTEVAAQGVLYTEALTRHRPEPARPAALAAARHRRPGAAVSSTERLADGRRPGAARARRRGAARDQRPGGHRGRRAPAATASSCRPGR